MQARVVPLDVRCGPTDWAVVTGWQKLLLSLAVMLPIPMLAMSGLAVPLPSAVYRAATAFVESTQGFTGVLAVREAETLAPTPLRSVPVPNRQVAEPPSTPPGRALRTQPVLAQTRSAGHVAAERTSAVGARRSSRSPSAPTPAVAEPPHTGSTSGADAAASPAATAGSKPAAPTSPTPSSTTEQNSRPVEVAQVAPIAPPVSPPPAPSPPPPASPPPTLEPVTKALEPVTKPLEPVTNILAPVTNPVTNLLDPITAPVLRTGRLLRP